MPVDDMLRTFNMGIGLTVVCRSADAETVIGKLAEAGEPAALRIGEIVDGAGVSYS